jgi:hypothetical protein
MSAKIQQRRWGALGGRASFSSITDPIARAEARRARALKANAARQAKYPPKPKPSYIAPEDPGDPPVDIPGNAFTATDDDGEWESFGDIE